jgi:hypothetical protein
LRQIKLHPTLVAIMTIYHIAQRSAFTPDMRRKLRAFLDDRPREIAARSSGFRTCGNCGTKSRLYHEHLIDRARAAWRPASKKTFYRIFRWHLCRKTRDDCVVLFDLSGVPLRGCNRHWTLRTMNGTSPPGLRGHADGGGGLPDHHHSWIS